MIIVEVKLSRLKSPVIKVATENRKLCETVLKWRALQEKNDFLIVGFTTPRSRCRHQLVHLGGCGDGDQFVVIGVHSKRFCPEGGVDRGRSHSLRCEIVRGDVAGSYGECAHWS